MPDTMMVVCSQTAGEGDAAVMMTSGADETAATASGNNIAGPKFRC